jgi:hypothetical protein
MLLWCEKRKMNGMILTPCLHAYLLEICKTMGVFGERVEAREREGVSEWSGLF